MQNFSSYIIPVIIAIILMAGLYKGVNIFDTFICGAKEGLSTCISILPPLIALITAVGMVKASGALDIIAYTLRDFSNLLGMPSEVMPLAILRPISGSGALAMFKEILDTYGADSYIGLVASVMQGATETTFYTIAVYYGAVNIIKTRHTLPSALAGDLTGFIMSALCVRLFLM
ncbi:MAG: spore maturation protein [Oscillospiraceae bacterium]